MRSRGFRRPENLADGAAVKFRGTPGDLESVPLMPGGESSPPSPSQSPAPGHYDSLFPRYWSLEETLAQGDRRGGKRKMILGPGGETRCPSSPEGGK